MFDIIIIGAGTAGLTAAIYSKRASKNILVFEKNNYGGQIITSTEVENYPGLKKLTGYEFATKLYEQVNSFGIEINKEQVIKINDFKGFKEVITNENTYKTKTIIIATGSKKRMLGCKNEKQLIGKGLSYCATCDGNFYKKQEVAIVGGGNTALEDAIFLSNICKRVYIIYRKDKLKADDILVQTINKKENVEVIYNTEVINIIGENKLEGIEIINNTNNEKEKLSITGLFVAIGQIPDNEVFEELIELDEKGYIKAGEDCKTNIPGIFTAGDCRTKKYRQLTTAAADGTISALNAVEYINKKGGNL